MILVDLDKSYQNIPKSPRIARKKCHFYGDKNRVFFSFCIKKALRSIQNRNHTYVYIQLVKSYQNHYHMTLDDLPFVKKWGIKKFTLSDFGYFKGITGAICNGIKR